MQGNVTIPQGLRPEDFASLYAPQSNYMQQPMQPQNVPVAPVDQNFSIPNPEMGPQPTQVPPQLQHINDVLNEYVNSKQQQTGNNGITEQILANRFQPTMQDIGNSITQTAQSYARPDLFRPSTPETSMAQRYEAELSPYTSMLSNQMRAGTQYMNMSGGGTGVLINRLMQENPGMTFQDALYAVQSGMKQNLQMNPQGVVAPIQGAPQAAGQMQFGKQSGEQAANLQFAGPIATAKTAAEESQKAQYAAPIAQATKTGEIKAENIQQGSQTNDIVGLYNKLISDSQTTPSGAIGSGYARLTNLAGAPSQGALAQARFDADLNNLYLATIRSLKGTGKIMEMELDKIGQAAPLSTDSNEVKMIKAQAHMQYYTQRMHSLGFDPGADQSANIPNPPTPDQIQQQMPSASATHRYNPSTGQLEPMQ